MRINMGGFLKEPGGRAFAGHDLSDGALDILPSLQLIGFCAQNRLWAEQRQTALKEKAQTQKQDENVS